VVCSSVAISGLSIAACGGGGSARTVASLPGHSGRASSGSPLTVAAGDRDMVEFARCMRADGVQMSDPRHIPGHNGLSIDLPPHDSATAHAYGACVHLIQQIIDAKNSGAASEAAPIMARLTSYAECMRARDIDMLDPTPQGQLNLGNVPGITADFGRYSPQFRQADRRCRHLLPATVHDNGTGP
jgi:hypothetical protein